MRAHDGPGLFAEWYDAAATEEKNRISRLLGVSTQAMWTWKSRSRRPEPHVRTALASVLGIPEEAWLSASEREVVRRSRKASGA